MHEAPARAHEQQVTRLAAWLGLGLALGTGGMALIPGVTTLPLWLHGVLSAGPAAAAVLLLTGLDEGPPARRRLAVRGLVTLLLLGIFLGVGVNSAADGVGIGLAGIVLVLSALTLDTRDHVAAVALAVIGTVVVFTVNVEDPAGQSWLAIPGLAVGVLAGIGARAHRRALDEVEAQRRAAASTSAALRAVVDGAAASTKADHQEVLDAVTRATSALDSDISALCLLGGDDRAYYGSTHGVPAALRERSFPADEGITGAALRSGGTVVTDDYGTFDNGAPVPWAARLRAAIAVPIRVGDELVGALVAGRYGPEPYDEPSVAAFELLAEHASGAIALARAIGADRAMLAQLRRLRMLQEDFVSTVSHELRTPLTVIDGVAETLRVRGGALSPELRDELLDSLTDNTRALSAAVTSILDLAELDRGLAEFAPRPVPLDALVAGVASRLAPVLEEHHLELELETVQVVGDGPMLERVIENLLVNVVRHTPPGTTASVAVASAADVVEVTVTDDGPGIPAHEVAHVTEPFRRIGSHRTRESRGFGIGLALVEQILRLHRAELLVSSEVGRGTCFSFALRPATTRSRVATTRST